MLRQCPIIRPRRSFEQKDLVREKSIIHNFGHEPSELDMKTFKDHLKKSHSVRFQERERFNMIAQERILNLKESKNTKKLLRNLRLIEEGE